CYYVTSGLTPQEVTELRTHRQSQRAGPDPGRMVRATGSCQAVALQSLPPAVASGAADGGGRRTGPVVASGTRCPPRLHTQGEKRAQRTSAIPSLALLLPLNPGLQGWGVDAFMETGCRIAMVLAAIHKDVVLPTVPMEVTVHQHLSLRHQPGEATQSGTRAGLRNAGTALITRV
ncbi:hypothetical protein JZ751_011536, partial [Albula glossodonta]